MRSWSLSGTTPITVTDFPLSRITLPTTFGSPPSFSLQNLSLATTTSLWPGWSSSGVNTRPMDGAMPSVAKKLPEAWTPSARYAGSPGLAKLE